ncbi:MAG: radical SAM protein [Oscillospiraceae bacterium]|nr:radical SAM protein [Oscillospiraceae bacterium]
MVVREIQVKDYLTKSSLPASDYVINPYVGCPHACKYCYACFMKRFTGHDEQWGTFIDVKRCDKPVDIRKLKGKSVFLSSVTDCYNSFEEKYEITRNILKQLAKTNCEVSISTKSSLILRDIDILKTMPNLKVCFSVNTLDEKFGADMDNASTIGARLDAMHKLHDAGIHTVLFMSPIFPYITEWKEIIERTWEFADEYWFENLNLRGDYKVKILDYIAANYPHLGEEYKRIYVNNNSLYWNELGAEIEEYCTQKNVKFTNFFYHSKLVKEKKNKANEQMSLFSE